jgi:hypothetical protein
MENKKKKYVVLEHLTYPHKGQRFWSTNTDNNVALYTGEIVYKEIFFTDSEREAINKCGYTTV